ncbi:MAG: enoyl-CoA hydratase/isomerase family protein, partial [Proteobacteria bacterium]|nr:enoyl-CoA hydratase/isomerase family protein [Pseudomonadota bacterium]
MEYKNIIFKIEEQIATITFNRPEVLNALNEASLKEFSHAIEKVAGDEDIRVLILTGAGD